MEKDNIESCKISFINSLFQTQKERNSKCKNSFNFKFIIGALNQKTNTISASKMFLQKALCKATKRLYQLNNFEESFFVLKIVHDYECKGEKI